MPGLLAGMGGKGPSLEEKAWHQGLRLLMTHRKSENLGDGSEKT